MEVFHQHEDGKATLIAKVRSNDAAIAAVKEHFKTDTVHFSVDVETDEIDGLAVLSSHSAEMFFAVR